MATRFKYKIRLKCHDEHEAGLDDACRDNSISSNSYCPYPTLSKSGSFSLPENSNSDVSNWGGPRFFIPQWQANSKNNTDKTKIHYDRDVRTILEKWRSDSISTPVNHVEGLYNTAIPLYTNVVHNLAKVDPQQVTKSHILDLESYGKVVKLWHKFKRPKTVGRHNYPNISNIYNQIVDLEQPHNNRVSEFMQQTEERIRESINKQCADIKEDKSGHGRFYDMSSIFRYFICRPQQVIQMKNDRYVKDYDGLICKRLSFESNITYTIAKVDENTAEILKRIISDEYEASYKILKELQEQLETINQLANQFIEQISFVILCADNHGLKGKCVVGI